MVKVITIRWWLFATVVCRYDDDNARYITTLEKDRIGIFDSSLSGAAVANEEGLMEGFQ